MHNLTELNVTDTDLGAEGLASLAPLRQLRVLHLSGCKVTNASLATLKSFPLLLTLSLDCATITDAGLIFLRPLKPTLTRLDIFEASVGDGGVDHLQGFGKLQYLELCSGRLSNVGLGKIASALPGLTSLNVSQNQRIDDAGVEALRRLANLVHVNLSGTGVSHKGLAFLSEHKLGGSGSGGGGGSATAQGQGANLLSTPALQRISLFGCDVKVTSAKLAALPPGVQLGIDSGVLSVD